MQFNTFGRRTRKIFHQWIFYNNVSLLGRKALRTTNFIGLLHWFDVSNILMFVCVFYSFIFCSQIVFIGRDKSKMFISTRFRESVSFINFLCRKLIFSSNPVDSYRNETFKIYRWCSTRPVYVWQLC